MANAPLRGCPTCGTKVTDVDMGLRDYRWVADVLPGREAPMDFDCVYEKGGRFLVLEFKPAGGFLPMGQRLTLKAAVRTGFFDVWVVWELPDKTVQVQMMDRRGDLGDTYDWTRDELAFAVLDWREDHV